MGTEQVAQLRARAAAGEAKSKLANDFGISRETVYASLRAAP
ncbi:helix-turn-helix domain-containing protein [Nocardia salmonicida]